MGWGYVFAPAMGAVLAFSSGRTKRAAPYVAHLAVCAAAVRYALQLQHPGRVRPPISLRVCSQALRFAHKPLILCC